MTGAGGWASAAPHDPPGEPLVPFDATRPNVARAYDYLLGGKDNFAPDRELGEKILAIYPGARQMARENRRFLLRALSYVLPHGIAQYADLGAGLPTSPAVHELVRQHSARAAICYVDNDPVVISHLGALVANGDDRIRDVPGDLTDPPAVLSALQATGLIDWDQPVCLILAMVLHFLDASTARELVTAYRSALAPGSYVVISVARGEERIGRQVTQAYDAATLYNHPPGDVASFFAGLTLVPPGIVDARAWQPGWLTSPPFMLRDGQVIAGVAIKP